MLRGGEGAAWVEENNISRVKKVCKSMVFGVKVRRISSWREVGEKSRSVRWGAVVDSFIYC